MTVVLTGLDIEKKAKIVEDTFFDSIGGKEQFQTVDVQLIRSDKCDPSSNDEAFAFLRITVMDQDAKRASRFSNKVVELVLASIPGFTITSPPGRATQTVVHWPSLVSMKHLTQVVEIADQKLEVQCAAPDSAPVDVHPKKISLPSVPEGPMVQAPMGRVFATRSGDKGGNANLGVWAKTPEAFAFLREFLTSEKLKELLPDCAPYEIERFELANLLAVNFYIHGILGDGVAASFRSDPQAKTLGEYLRAKVIEMPASIVPDA